VEPAADLCNIVRLILGYAAMPKHPEHHHNCSLSLCHFVLELCALGHKFIYKKSARVGRSISFMM